MNGLILGAILLVGAGNRLPLFSDFFKSLSLEVQTKSSENFAISWVNPGDEIVVAPLLDHLEKAHLALAPVFAAAAKRNPKVSVEIFPDLKTFSAVSGLALARFRATGTIALTLDQRLMILSPRNLVSGFPWAITAVHEYAHYLIREISMDHIPIWLHEGVAQYFQEWPQTKDLKISPSDWGLFKKYRDKKALLSFEALKEPFPYKKNPEEAALAYAQSLIFVEILQNRCGLVQLLRWAEEKKSVDKALKACLKSDRPENVFRKTMATVKIPPLKHVDFYARDFSSEDPFKIESQRVERKARDFAQLSFELFQQGRFHSSTVEMDKAFKSMEVPPPSWARQMALALSKSGQPKRSDSILTEHLRNYPDDAAAWFLRARQWLDSQQREKAWAALMRAFFINPFMEDLRSQITLMTTKNPELRYGLFAEGPEQ